MGRTSLVVGNGQPSLSQRNENQPVGSAAALVMSPFDKRMNNY